MSMLLALQVFQHGPNGGLVVVQRYFWILLLVPVLLAIFLLYRFFLPTLNKVEVSEKMEDIVVKTAAEEGEVKDQKIADVTRRVGKDQQERKLLQMRIENRDQVIRDLRKELTHLQGELDNVKVGNQEKDQIIQDLKRQLELPRKPGTSSSSGERAK